jgi:flagellar biosynthetic protein FliP
VREQDLALFVSLSGMDKPESPADLPTYLIIPGFVISELRIAFQISFILFIPFLIIDMVVASVLMSMGMLMLPPIMVSLPFKILLFVLVDGWYLIVKSLVSSFN